jgi:hypothetical protein
MTTEELKKLTPEQLQSIGIGIGRGIMQELLNGWQPTMFRLAGEIGRHAAAEIAKGAK